MSSMQRQPSQDQSPLAHQISEEGTSAMEIHVLDKRRESIDIKKLVKKNKTVEDVEDEEENEKAQQAHVARAKANEELREKVRMKIRLGWRNDDNMLDEFFQGAITNWKVYKGERTPKQVLKVQSLYKQALYGDVNTEPPSNMKSKEGIKWNDWFKYKGMPQDMAKRRFITYLSEIDASIIDVMPSEKPPVGFPLDAEGRPICAKCNTSVGCARPLMNQHKMDLRKQLFETEELHEPAALREWLKDAMQNQRCLWGIHKAVTDYHVKPFLSWFNRADNGGFYAYNSGPITSMIKDLVEFQYEVAYDMMMNKDDHSPEAYNTQAIRCSKLKEMYDDLSGLTYQFEIPCTRMDELTCNQRRIADKGENHSHPFDIDPPTFVDVASHSESIELRLQCQALGLPVATGVVPNISTRCEIYRKRIAEHFKALEVAKAAKIKNENRAEVHQKEKQSVKALTFDMLIKQCQDACQANKAAKVMTLCKRGAPIDTESPRGITPLICMILNNAPPDYTQTLIKLKANLNYVNMYGMTALMVACRVRDTKTIHILLKNGASVLQNGGRRGGNYTALHWCAIHGAEEPMKIMIDYVREGGGDILRVNRSLDFQSFSGDSALMLAARRRNGLACRVLLLLGANPNIRNAAGRNACFLARESGWGELADWIEKKIGAGVANLESFSDVQYDKTVRSGAVKLTKCISEFAKVYLQLIQGQVTDNVPNKTPSLIKYEIASKGKAAEKRLAYFVERNQMMILKRPLGFNSSVEPLSKMQENEAAEKKAVMLEMLMDMQRDMRLGNVSPNLELFENPVPWTALMCAVALNDVRLARLFIREGCGVNHPNRFGQTAVMLACQLNNIDILVELLVLGGDINLVDNEGYNCMAYATSLPLPDALNHTAVGTILGSDIEGPKRYNATDILKMADTDGVKILNDAVTQNEEDCDMGAVKHHFKLMKLLESHGLTRIETVRQVNHTVQTAGWRINPESYSRTIQDDVSETSSEARERGVMEKYLTDQFDAEKALMASDFGVPRCPVCTLLVPCVHFFKVAALRKHLAMLEESGEAVSNAGELVVPKKKLKAKDVPNTIMKDAELDDRNTDRNLTLVTRYRKKLWQAQEEGNALKKAKTLKEKKENEKLAGLLDGSWVEWGRRFDRHGAVHWQHADTEEKWFECPCQDQPAEGEEKHLVYFFNPDSGESIWELPRLDFAKEHERLSKEILDREQAIRIANSPHVDEFPSSPPKSPPKSPTKAVVTDKAISEAVASGDSGGEEVSTIVTTDGDPEAEPVDLSALQLPPRTILKKVASVPGTGSGLRLAVASPVEKKKKHKRRVVFSDTNEQNVITDAGDVVINKISAKSGEIIVSDSKAVDSEKQDAAATDTSEEATTEAEERRPEALIKSDHYFEHHNPLKDSKLIALKDLNAPATAKELKRTVALKQQKSTQNSGNKEKNVSLLVDLKKHRNEMFSDLVPNPVPVEGRGMFMFSQEFFDRNGQTDGLVLGKKRMVKALSLEEQQQQILQQQQDQLEDQQQKEKVAKEVENVLLERQSIKTILRKAKHQQKVRVKPPELILSGWVFVSLCTLETGKPPLKQPLSLTSDVWGGVLKHIQHVFIHDWLPAMHFSTLMNAATWRIDPDKHPRCYVCGIGYCRWRNVETFEPVDRLCMVCVTRRELYNKVKQSLPRSFRVKNCEEWPFKFIQEPSGRPSSKGVKSYSPRGSRPSSRDAGFRRPGSNSQSRDTFSPIRDERDSSGTCSLPDIHTNRLGNTITLPPSTTAALSATLGVSSGRAVHSKELLLIDAVEHQYDKEHQPVFDKVMTRRRNASDKDSSASALSPGTVADVPGFLTNTKYTLADPWMSLHPPPDEEELEADAVEANSPKNKKKAKNKLSSGNVQGGGKPGSPSSDRKMSPGRINTKDEEVEDKPELSSSQINKNLRKKIGPKELTLLSFLIAKGHYEEVERVTRMTLENTDIDDGEGMGFLCKLLVFQAELYKQMGLWTLALCLYLDVVDLICSLVGFDDGNACVAIGGVTNCLRKMHLPLLAKEFMSSVVAKLEAQRGFRLEVMTNITHYDKVQIKNKIKLDSIWNAFKPLVPTNGVKKRAFLIHGLGSLFNVMVASDGFGVVSRLAFISHCQQVDPSGLGKVAEFAAYCFKIRVCDDPEIFRHFVVHMSQHLLNDTQDTNVATKRRSYNLALTTEENQTPSKPMSMLFSLYKANSTDADIEALKQFIELGRSIPVTSFDKTLKMALLKLTREYKTFFYSAGGQVVRSHYMDADADAMDVNATMIQCIWRLGRAKRLVRLRKNKGAGTTSVAERAADCDAIDDNSNLSISLCGSDETL